MLFLEKHSRNGNVNLYTTLVWVRKKEKRATPNKYRTYNFQNNK